MIAYFNWFEFLNCMFLLEKEEKNIGLIRKLY
jgi:hypothetical protein